MRMKILGSLALGLLIGPMVAQANTVSMTLTGVQGYPLGGVYTSPYTATINGVPTTVYCDDFTTDVYVGLSWQANVTNMGALSGITSPLTTVKFDRTITTTALAAAQQQQQDYMTVAYLAEQLAGTNPSTQAAGDLSFALWAVFDPAALGAIGGSDLANAQADLSNAQGAVRGLDPSVFSNVNIYSASPFGASQEYIVVNSVPEPATLTLFGLGLAGLGFMRRRKAA